MVPRIQVGATPAAMDNTEDFCYAHYATRLPPTCISRVVHILHNCIPANAYIKQICNGKIVTDVVDFLTGYASPRYKKILGFRVLLSNQNAHKCNAK